MFGFFIIKQIGSGEKHSTSSRVFPYTSFVLYRFLRALQQNRAQSRLLYLLIKKNKLEYCEVAVGSKNLVCVS